MQGVTTALVAAIIVGLMFPNFVKNRSQFYGAFGAVLVIILLDGLGQMVQGDGRGGLRVAVYGINSLLQISGLVLIASSVSGRTLAELRNDAVGAARGIRDQDDDEPIVRSRRPIDEPIREAMREPIRRQADEPPVPIVLDPTNAPEVPRKPGDNKGPLPFE